LKAGTVAAQSFPVTVASWWTFVALALGGAALLMAYGHGLTVLALMVCLVAAIPVILARGKFDLFAPWNYLCYFVLLTVLLRSILIDFEVTGDRVDLDFTFYRGEDRDFMVRAILLIFVGFVFLVAGYLLPPARPAPLGGRIFSGVPFDPRRLRPLLVVLLLISVSAFAAFVAVTFQGVGEFAWKMLSSHRGVTDDLSEYRAHGYLRLLAGLSSLVILLSYAQLRAEPRPRNKRFYRRALGVAMFVSIAMAFYSQSRAQLIFVFLNIIFVKYYLDGRRFPWRIFAFLAPVIVTIFILVSSLRAGTGVDFERITPMTVVAPIVLTTGGIDASKTAHIADYVDDTQDYKFGGTLVQFLTAVVPRQIWPEKPVNLDTYIGEKIYGAELYGSAAVPAGLFGEMYMNFWYAGIVIGALALGVAMRKIDNLLIANRGKTAFVLVYVLMLQSFGMSVLASGFSSTMVGVLSAGIPLLLSLRFITPKRRVPAAK
jgi:oligosaccharide repeat unit polymerase